MALSCVIKSAGCFVRCANIGGIAIERIIRARGQFTRSGRDHEHSAHPVVDSDQFAIIIKRRPQSRGFQDARLRRQFNPVLQTLQLFTVNFSPEHFQYPCAIFLSYVCVGGRGFKARYWS